MDDTVLGLIILVAVVAVIIVIEYIIVINRRNKLYTPKEPHSHQHVDFPKTKAELEKEKRENEKNNHWNQYAEYYINGNEQEVKNLLLQKADFIHTRRVKIIATIGIAFACFYVVFMIMYGINSLLPANSMFSGIFMVLFYAAAFVVIIFVYFYVQKLLKGYNPYENIDIERICTERYLIPVLRNIFNDPQLIFSKHGHGWLNGALPLHDRLTINNQVTTHIDGCRVVFSDFKTEKSVPDSNGDGHHYETNWSGELYEIESKKAFSGFTRIIPTTTNKLGKEVNHKFHKFDPEREVKVETDNIWFNEHFDVYSSDKMSAIYFLTPEIIDFFAREYAQQHYYIACVTDNKIYITVPGSRFYKGMWDCKENANFINWVSHENVFRQNQNLYQHVRQIFDFFNRS